MQLNQLSIAKYVLETLSVAAMTTCFVATSAYGQTWTGTFSDQWFHGANWSDGAVPLGTNNDVIVGAPAPTIFQQSAQLNSLTVEAGGILQIGMGNFTNPMEFGGTELNPLSNSGQIEIQSGSHLEFKGDVFNDGTIEVFSNGFAASVRVNENGASIDGGGVIRLFDNSASIQAPPQASSILNIDDQLIEGYGSVGLGDLTINNSSQGLIDANVNGETLRFNGDEGSFNEGVLRASGGGNLELRSAINNDNGIIEALDGSSVGLLATEIEGGTIRSEGSGQVNLGNNVPVKDLLIDAALDVLPGRTLSIAGTVANEGTIHLQGPDSVNFASLGLHEDATLTGGGTVVMSGNNATIEGASRELTLGNQTIEGEGTIGRGFLTRLIDSIDSTIDANVPGEILEVDIDDSTTTSLGTLRASNGGTLVFTKGLIADGTVHVEENSVVEADLLAIGAQGRASGSGRINSNREGETVSSIHGIIAPGDVDSPGTLTLYFGNLGAVMSATAGLEIDIANQSDFDQFRLFTGTSSSPSFSGIHLGGTLSVNLEGGYLPADDDTFEIVSADISPTCTPLDCTQITRFSNTGLPGFEQIDTAGGEGTFEINYGFNSVTLKNFTPSNPGSSVAGGSLTVIGSGEIDDISVSSTGVPGAVQVVLNGTVENFTGVSDILIQAYAGDDVINVSLGGAFNGVTIRGGRGDDEITLNGSVPGVIHGDRGNDVITGGSGPDDISGGDGIDELAGRGGADSIDAGFEFLQEPGIHQIEGGTGADIIVGSIGDDDIFGNDGADVILGQNGDDVISGGLGNDCISGGFGVDELRGGSGSDVIVGGRGNDFISGDIGLDDLYGGFGDDVIYGGGAADILTGGSGDDELYGGPGADKLYGGGFDDFLSGGSGPDNVFGHSGDDTIFGNSGNDRLSGGAGTDTLNGGSGVDTGLDTGETEIGIEN